jgi:3-hydroxyisobutyrate dehydrogenase
MKIAFIGLGNMGAPMAHNLHKAGHALSAFDLSAEACRKLGAEGVPIAPSAADTLAGADVVISMLPASQHVESLYFGSEGQPGLLKPGPSAASRCSMRRCRVAPAAPSPAR